jgi:hypothetical protein
MFGMDSSNMIILDYQRRSLFSVILSSSIPFCISDYFITNNKDALRHNNTKGVNHISSHPFHSHIESSLNKNKNNNTSPFFEWLIFFFSFSFIHFYLQHASYTNSIGNGTGVSSSFGGNHSSKPDSTQSTDSGSTTQLGSHSSHVGTHQSPYQHSYHHQHHRGNRSHYRGSGHSRNEPLPKKTTGIPRDGLIQIPRHIPGAFRDQTGTSVVPRQMA